MAGTSAGARKAVNTRHRKRLESAETQLAMAQANQEGHRGGGYVHGLDVSLQKITEEYVPELREISARVDLFRRMGSDPKIAAQIQSNILPLISAVRWRVDGGDEEMRDLVAANLLRHGDRAYWCETSWQQRLLEMLQCLKYGFAMFGKTREVVDGYMIFRRLTYLHPRSLRGTMGPWEWDKSGTRLVAIHRSYPLPDGGQEADERIPIDDVFATVWWMTGDNWEGEALIRSMYRPWKEKDLASKIEMIDLLNRGVGIPKAKLGPRDGTKEIATATTIAKDMRQGSKERAFIIEGHEQEYKYLTSEGETQDYGSTFARRNMEIGSAGGTDFKQANQGETGSRALGSVLMVSYMQQLEAIKEWIQEQVNHGAGYMQGLVEELIYSNFDGVEECPRIVGSRVSPTEQLDNAPNIVTAIQQGAITHDLGVENYLRRSYGVAEMTPDEFQRAKAMNEPLPNLGGRPGEVTPIDRDEPRDDDAGRAFGLAVEKKTPDGCPMTRKGASYPWLTSSRS